jgi:hypothetical protein
MKSNSIRWVPLALAGIVGVVLTWFGLMGSAFSQPGQQNPVAVTLIWLLPLLSLPALVTYSLWKRMPPAALWGLVLCQWMSFSWINWDSSLRGQSTTSNPILLALSGGVAFPAWCWIIIAGLCQFEYRLRHRDLNTDEGHVGSRFHL